MRHEGSDLEWRELRARLRVVEVEVCTSCNRACSYCPQSHQLVNGSHLIDRRVLYVLWRDLARIEFEGRLSYHLYNEPLLHPSLEEIVAEAKQVVPGARQVLFTNGDLLDQITWERLTQAGVCFFVVTRHSRGKYPERDNQLVQFRRDLHLTSRAGAIKWIAAHDVVPDNRPCHAMNEMAVVGHDGQVLRCYEDAARQHVQGNLLSTSLAAIWSDTQNRSDRLALMCGKRADVGGICGRCCNRDHVEADRSVASEPFWDLEPAARRVANALRSSGGSDAK